jgi:hypothetical protein
VTHSQGIGPILFIGFFEPPDALSNHPTGKPIKIGLKRIAGIHPMRIDPRPTLALNKIVPQETPHELACVIIV